eukprot:gene10103-7070_t
MSLVRVRFVITGGCHNLYSGRQFHQVVPLESGSSPTLVSAVLENVRKNWPEEFPEMREQIQTWELLSPTARFSQYLTKNDLATAANDPSQFPPDSEKSPIIVHLVFQQRSAAGGPPESPAKKNEGGAEPHGGNSSPNNVRRDRTDDRPQNSGGLLAYLTYTVSLFPSHNNPGEVEKTPSANVFLEKRKRDASFYHGNFFSFLMYSRHHCFSFFSYGMNMPACMPNQVAVPQLSVETVVRQLSLCEPHSHPRHVWTIMCTGHYFVFIIPIATSFSSREFVAKKSDRREAIGPVYLPPPSPPSSGIGVAVEQGMRPRRTTPAKSSAHPPLARRPRKETVPEAALKDASEWSREDKTTILNYLAGLVASTFEEGVSSEDVQRVLKEEKAVVHTESIDAEYSPADDAKRDDENVENESQSDDEEVPLRVSDIAVSSEWRQKLTGRGGGVRPPAPTLAVAPALPTSTPGELPPPKRKWECRQCGAEQEIIDARKAMRSKAPPKSLAKSGNLQDSESSRLSTTMLSKKQRKFIKTYYYLSSLASFKTGPMASCWLELRFHLPPYELACHIRLHKLLFVVFFILGAA